MFMWLQTLCIRTSKSIKSNTSFTGLTNLRVQLVSRTSSTGIFLNRYISLVHPFNSYLQNKDGFLTLFAITRISLFWCSRAIELVNPKLIKIEGNTIESDPICNQPDASLCQYSLCYSPEIYHQNMKVNLVDQDD